MPNAVVHFEVAGQDVEKLQKFYTDLFGWKMQPVPENADYTQVLEDGDGIAGGVIRSAGGPGHVTFYVKTPEDLQEVLDRAEKLGGSVVMPVTQLPQGFAIAQLADPEGHMIGLVEP